MKVEEIRNRLIDRIQAVAAGGDEEETARSMAFARAILVALTPKRADEDAYLQQLSVGTRTAALITGYHREYVRELVRRGELSATRSNGELQIPLAEIADHLSRSVGFGHPVHRSLSLLEKLTSEVKLRQ